MPFELRNYEYKKSSFLIKKFLFLKTLQTKTYKKIENKNPETYTFIDYYSDNFLKNHIVRRLNEVSYELEKYHHFDVGLLN